jgi:hypothetical protein
VKRLPPTDGVRVRQRGDDQANLRFPVEVLDRVFEIIRAWRKRQREMRRVEGSACGLTR